MKRHRRDDFVQWLPMKSQFMASNSGKTKICWRCSKFLILFYNQYRKSHQYIIKDDMMLELLVIITMQELISK